VSRKARGEGKETRLKVRVLGSPSPEALRQAYRMAAKKLVRELTEKCVLRSTSE
jgi:acetyl-CoA carboxylase alpha subunit